MTWTGLTVAAGAAQVVVLAESAVERKEPLSRTKQKDVPVRLTSHVGRARRKGTVALILRLKRVGLVNQQGRPGGHPSPYRGTLLRGSARQSERILRAVPK